MLYLLIVPIILLIANKFRLLFTYKADFIRYLTNPGKLQPFTKSVGICIVSLSKEIVKKRLDRKFKPGIWRKNIDTRFKISDFVNISLNVHLLALVFLIDTLTFVSST